ncbi:MAG: hypothetical protein GXP62_02050 [Oligoflexia bacterium]|nr:hypothetical protein [Oligoflexia bacterium]
MPPPPPQHTALHPSHALLRLAPWASGLALLAATTVLTWLYLAGAPAVPFGDESEHLADAWDLHRSLNAASSLPAWLHALAAPHNSYPNMLAALSQATTPLFSGIDGVRAAAASLVIVHALVALWLGPRLWGWSATVIYIALCCCGPILLSLSTLALLDGPSAAFTGIAVLLLLSSDGFSRPGLSAAFGLATAAALYTKWVLLVFLAPPIAWQIARAVVHSAPTRRARLGLALAMAAWAATLAAAVWQGGSHPAVQWALRSARQPWIFLCGPALGLLLAGLVATLGPRARHRDRTLSPALLAATALLIIALVAGPWYAGAWPDLLARLDHETAMIQLRGANPTIPFHRLFSDLGDLAPLQLLALVPGLFLALRRPLRLGDALSLLFGGLIGAVMVTRALPPDLRYLLPAVPPSQPRLQLVWPRPRAGWSSPWPPSSPWSRPAWPASTTAHLASVCPHRCPMAHRSSAACPLPGRRFPWVACLCPTHSTRLA